MALLLATMGIYGTVSHAVAQRRREVGIRMALGAASADILRLVVGEAMLLVGYGLGAGLLLGLLLTRALVSMPFDMPLLFGVSATDAATFAGVTVLLALVGLAACWVPALRATRVQPAVTLRSA
jgi:putative ABC transport system permease protein